MKKIMAILGVSALCMVSGADTVSFTAGEGYSTGLLNDHADWSGSTDYTVDTSGSGTVGWSAHYTQMNYKNGLAASAQTVESSIQFKMTQASGYTGGQKPVIGLMLEKDAVGNLLIGDGLNDVRTYIQRTSATTFNLVFNNATQGTSDNNLYAGFNESLLGLNGINGDISDLLELKLVLYRGATSADWTADIILKNVTTDTAITTVLGRAFMSDDAYFNSAIYGAFTGGLVDAGTGVNNRELESFTVIPEPATLGLIGFLSIGLLIARRFLSI